MLERSAACDQRFTSTSPPTSSRLHHDRADALALLRRQHRVEARVERRACGVLRAFLAAHAHGRGEQRREVRDGREERARDELGALLGEALADDVDERVGARLDGRDADVHGAERRERRRERHGGARVAEQELGR